MLCVSVSRLGNDITATAQQVEIVLRLATTTVYLTPTEAALVVSQVSTALEGYALEANKTAQRDASEDARFHDNDDERNSG